MDEDYLLAAARYVELNAVRAKLVRAPEEYRWSSALAHRDRQDDQLVKVAPLLKLIPDWPAFLRTAMGDGELDMLRRHDRTGRPLGDDSFLRRLEVRLGRLLRLQKPGRKRKS